MAEKIVDDRDHNAIGWLLASPEAGIRLQARSDLLGERIRIDPAEVVAGNVAAALLSGQESDGGFGGHPYLKWSGAHWRLVSLIELGVRGDEPASRAALEPVFGWLLSDQHRRLIKTIDGRTRRCASQEGNALGVAVRLGLAADERTARLAESLVDWQWPAGGWNCDTTASVTHPSVHESLPPMWGLFEYAEAAGNSSARAAANRAAEFFLDHHVYKSHRTGKVGNRRWTEIHFPAYWHYDIVVGLNVLALAGRLPDPRATDALQLLRDKQSSNGRWHPEGTKFWRRSGDMYRDPANWSSELASQMLTLKALRILRAAAA